MSTPQRALPTGDEPVAELQLSATELAICTAALEHYARCVPNVSHDGELSRWARPRELAGKLTAEREFAVACKRLEDARARLDERRRVEALEQHKVGGTI